MILLPSFLNPWLLWLNMLWLLCFQTTILFADDCKYFAIHVVDAETGRGVPLVELKTTNQVTYWTDSAGYIAINEPALWQHEVFFHIHSHGYQLPADFFGFRGIRILVEPGQSATIKIHRSNLAERLYRVTGADIYRDSLLLQRPVPISQPVNNSRVTGADSVLSAVFQGEMNWFWGDTNLHHYPLGVFHATGAVSKLAAGDARPTADDRQLAPLPPEHGVELEYFVDAKGEAKPMCPLPGDGPTWLEGLTVLSEPAIPEAGQSAGERMFAAYAKIKPPLDVYERGIVEWNANEQEFETRLRFTDTQQGYPMGHPVTNQHDGQSYVYYCRPLPLVRVPATAAALLDPRAYEVYTCIVPEPVTRAPRVERDVAGQLVWQWRRDGLLPTRELEAELVSQGKITESEQIFRLRTAGSDRWWTLHSASISWNAYRQRWIMLGLEIGGESSFLGELYYAEAENLLGPWSPAVKVVTHDKMTFYNPREHPMLSQLGGQILFFEGTYTQTFSNAPVATPRYDYNQIMYRLDLSNPQLHP